LCNKEVKFRAFLDYSLTLGADYIATGHYAQTCRHGDETWLIKGADPSKEQSYFLHAVSGEALNRTLFPVGALLKREIRSLAKSLNLVTHDKKDSTGICFIGERKFSDFLRTYLPAQPGPIRTLAGATIGEHQGLMYHTIGQRQGLGIGGVRGGNEEPWYVVEKQLDSNTLIIVQGAHHPMLYSTGLIASQCNWVSKDAPGREFVCTAKTRYRQPDQRCAVTLVDKGNAAAVVRFDHPQRAVTPGQSVVFYQGAVCLGGGIIESVSGVGNVVGK
jgi:tRNA-specific 2-thiouridylase